MRLVYLLFLAGLARGILGKSVTFADDDDFDFDVYRERRALDEDEDSELSDADYDNFYESSDHYSHAESSDYPVPYEFPVSDSSAQAADAATDASNLVKQLTKIANDVKAALANAKKTAASATKAAAAAKAAKAVAVKAAVAAAAKKAAPKKTAAKAGSASAKTATFNVVIRFPTAVFKPQLQKTTSSEYQAFGKKLQDALVALYSKDLLGFKINKLTPGSIVADLALKFLASTKDPLKKLKELIKKGKLAGLAVDTSFQKVYNKAGVLCSGACPSCASSACPVAASTPYPVAAPVMYPAPAPVYAPAAPIACPVTCPVACCSPQPVCPAACPPACCVNQG